MKFRIGLIILVFISSNSLSAQNKSEFSKEGRISAGFGYANGMGNSKNGSSVFVQMSYQLSEKFSLATEFEHLNYQSPGYFPELPIHLNVRNLYDDYYSLLIKYHLPLNSKFGATLASGWTFYTRQNQYYDFYRDATSQQISLRVSSYNDFGIPFLLDTQYPVWKNLGAGIRVKYNLNPGQGSTYSAGLGVSLKL